jgi:hypothetical protein
MIGFLSGRSHSHGYDHYPFCWNIKCHFSYSEDGMTGRDGKPIIMGRFSDDDGKTWDEATNNPAFNDKWESWLSADTNWGDVFDWVREDILGFTGDHPHWDYFEGMANGELDNLNVKLHTFGRSGGWLVISEYENGSLFRKYFNDLGLDEWSWTDLHRLYRVAQELDKFVDVLPQNIEYAYAFQRGNKEEEWAHDIAEQVAMYIADISTNAEDLTTTEQLGTEIAEALAHTWSEMEDEWGESAKPLISTEFYKQAGELMAEWFTTIQENATAQEESFGAFAPHGGG